MGKVLAGLVIAAVIVGGSVLLYWGRHRLFRPDLARVGGTRLVLAIEGDAAAVADALCRRFDPSGAEGIASRVVDGGVEVDVPNGRRHDENLERVRRLGRRPGRLAAGPLSHPADDPEATAAAEAWLAAPPNRQALEEAHAKGEPLPPLAGRHRWVAADAGRSSLGVFSVPGGRIVAREHFPVWHEWKRPAGGVIHFVPFREPPDGQGVTNADVGRPRVEYVEGRAHARLTLPFEGDGRRRVHDLITQRAPRPAKPPRQVAVVLDDDVLIHFDLGVNFAEPVFQVMTGRGREQADDVTALLRSPLPAGASVKVEKEQTLPGR